MAPLQMKVEQFTACRIKSVHSQSPAIVDDYPHAQRFEL